MRTRIAGSFIVVACILVPTVVGGPVFAVLMAALGVIGYHEYLALAEPAGVRRSWALEVAGCLAIAALALIALLDAGVGGLFIVTALAIAAPLVLLLGGPEPRNGLTSWSLASSGTLYLGLPVFAATTIRVLPGDVNAMWLNQAASSLSIGWDPAPRGLAWALVAILVTWTNDSTAYLAGRAFGRRKLAPSVSPGKTVEGSLGGLVGAALVGSLAFSIFGLGAWWLGAVAGVVIGVAGQLGDLGESLFKREAGVKDSGSLIPGHGGILDRIDSLLFAFPTTLILMVCLEGLGVI